MYYIGKYMRNFGSSYNDAIEMNWFTFNDLLESLRIVHSEEDLRGLSVADNHIKIESKNKEDFIKKYKELNAQLSEGISIKDTDYKKGWDSLRKLAGGE